MVLYFAKPTDTAFGDVRPLFFSMIFSEAQNDGRLSKAGAPFKRKTIAWLHWQTLAGGLKRTRGTKRLFFSQFHAKLSAYTPKTRKHERPCVNGNKHLKHVDHQFHFLGVGH
jgi:hypothetical protein